jgi:DNA-binding MarR family transcriptional regulator
MGKSPRSGVSAYLWHSCMVQATSARLAPDAIARETVADPATAEAIAALVDLMGVLHRTRILHQQGAPGRALLLQLARSGSMRPADLAKSMNLDQSTVSRHVAQLCETGLVERAADPSDGRASVLRITDAGWQQAHAFIRGRISDIASILDTWPAEDRSALGRLLGAFTAAFDDLMTSPRPTAAGQPTPQQGASA